MVSLGAQKNFVAFMDKLNQQHGKDFLPDESFYKELIAKAIIFKIADKTAKEENIQAYKANVVAYAIALLSHRCAGRYNFIDIWNSQNVPEDMQKTLRQWMSLIYDLIVDSAGQRNITEWCKKEACWKVIRESSLELSSSFRSELERNQPDPTVGRKRFVGGGQSI
jgi:hypothetical protein